MEICLAKGSSKAFSDEVDKAIDYLQKSDTARKIISYLEQNERIIELQESVIGDKHLFNKSLDKSYIQWSPKEGLIPSDGGVISPSRLLFHELFHAYSYTEEGEKIVEGILDDMLLVNSSEILEEKDLLEEITTAYEGEVGSELGEESKRNSYDDFEAYAVVPDPTFSKDPVEDWEGGL